jgi:hypothetical protein
MKKWLCLFVILLTCSIGARAQKNDYVWLAGYGSAAGYDSATQHFYGISVLDFNFDSVRITSDSLGMNFDRTNTSFSNEDGSLLFYSNGIYIANVIDQKIENGDSLNAGAFQYWWDPSIQTHGYRTMQGVIALRVPGQTNRFYLLHTFIDTLGDAYHLITSKLFYTEVDMNANGGHGRVISKNNTVLTGNLGEDITAVKHGNGRDWWILVQKRNTNCFYRVLVDATGIHELPGLICGGRITSFRHIGSNSYSSDGSKFAYMPADSGINLYDFDRCSATFTNVINLPLPQGMFGMSVAFSPNNRYLYAASITRVYQFDLWAVDINSSIDTIAKYDGFQSPYGSYFYTMQLGPNGKIYESCGNAEDVYHVIDRPDEKGDSCLFRQHAIHLPTFSLGVPNFPNYRLGALPGSPCDSLTGLNDVARAEKEKLLKVFPNPATNFVTIDYGFTDWNKGEVSLEITNELGQVVHQQPVPMYSGFQKVEVQNFAPGMYTAFIKRKGQVVATAKFAKQ